jgi:hypothetical protein
MKYPKINETAFGEITIDRKQYQHDLYLLADRRIKERDKNIARKRYGTSHKIGKKELKYLCREKPTILFIGTGQSGQARLTSKGKRYLHNHEIKIRTLATPDLIEAWNRSKKCKAALIHITC